MSERVSIKVTAKDIVDNIPKFPTHEAYIKYRFAKEKDVVIHDHDQLFHMRGASDTFLVYEITATLGKGCAHRPDEAKQIVEKFGGPDKAP